MRVPDASLSPPWFRLDKLASLFTLQPTAEQRRGRRPHNDTCQQPRISVVLVCAPAIMETAGLGTTYLSSRPVLGRSGGVCRVGCPLPREHPHYGGMQCLVVDDGSGVSWESRAESEAVDVSSERNPVDKPST